MSISRRTFLSAAAATPVLGLGSRWVGASSRGRQYRTALIGTGWWGTNILTEAVKAGRSKVVALCDVDATQLAATADELSALTSDVPRQYRDFREMFDQEQIEIAIIATPDHWHALQTIAALQHGAHVYVEKPTGHTVGESAAMVRAARAADRVVQVGLHRRIGPHHLSGMEFLKSGKVGKIGMVRMFVDGTGGPETPTPNSKPPSDLDWDLYCGPAPLRPFNRRIHPGGFRYFLDFANGILGDWGVHWIDQLLWWSEEQHPKRIAASGGRPIAGPVVLTETEQTTDVPDHQAVQFEFESFTATWEHHRFGGSGADKHPLGCSFIGTEGVFHMGWRDGWTFYPADGRRPVVHEDARFDNEMDGHNVPPLWQNFLSCIESGERPVADVEIGHRATTLSLLGMLSWKLGRSIEWDGERETIPNDDDACRLLKREYRAPWVYPA